YIIVYAGPGARPKTATAHAKWAKDYLVKLRSIAEKRIITIDGGCRDRLEVELYALPRTMSPPTPNPYCNKKTKLLPRLLVLHDEGRRRFFSQAEDGIRDEKVLCLLWQNRRAMLKSLVF